MTWINDTVLATSALDKTLKIWDYTNKSLLYHSKANNEIMQMAYCQKVILTSYFFKRTNALH
jgi:hypothetical protein